MSKRIESEHGWTSDKHRGKPIVCAKCGKSGGTLINIGDRINPNYVHQDEKKCQIMRVAK